MKKLKQGKVAIHKDIDSEESREFLFQLLEKCFPNDTSCFNTKKDAIKTKTFFAKYDKKYWDYFDQTDLPTIKLSTLMNPTYKISEKEIKLAYENPQVLKEMFPKVFEIELEVGKWYKSQTERGCTYAYFKGFDKECYGIAHYGDWVYNAIWFNKKGNIVYDNFGNNLEQLTTATAQEVQTALEIEAKKRGLVVCTWIKSVDNKICNVYESNYTFENNKLMLGKIVIFHKGQWATPIETITKEEAEKQLNKVIV